LGAAVDFWGSADCAGLLGADVAGERRGGGGVELGFCAGADVEPDFDEGV